MRDFAKTLWQDLNQEKQDSGETETQSQDGCPCTRISAKTGEKPVDYPYKLDALTLYFERTGKSRTLAREFAAGMIQRRGILPDFALDSYRECEQMVRALNNCVVDADDLMERFAIMTVDGNWQDKEALEELKRIYPHTLKTGVYREFLKLAGISEG